MSSRPRIRGRARLALAALLAVASVLVATTAGASTEGSTQATLDRSVRFLQDVQNMNGGYSGKPGGASDPTFSAWVAIGLAAAGINPKDQSQPGGESVWTYLTNNTRRFKYTTDYERVLLVAHAAGASPSRFGDIKPVREILSRQLPDGSFPHAEGGTTGGINDTVFAIIALSEVRDPRARKAVRRAAPWLIDHQLDNGGWSSFSPRSQYTSLDMTGAALEALNASGVPHGSAERRALSLLRSAQDTDGGFAQTPDPGDFANSASTTWVVQGLWAAGVDPASWNSPTGEDPLDYLASLQRSDGGIAWHSDPSVSNPDQNYVWMTGYTASALAGLPLPVPAVAREDPDPPKPDEEDEKPPVQGDPPEQDPRSGEGGKTPDGNGDVVAGGGGDGSPLFADPEPQSQGEIPAAPRQLSEIEGLPGGGDEPGPGTAPENATPLEGADTAPGGEDEVAGTVVAAEAGEGAPGLSGAPPGDGDRLALAVCGMLLALALGGSAFEWRGVRVAA